MVHVIWIELMCRSTWVSHLWFPVNLCSHIVLELHSKQRSQHELRPATTWVLAGISVISSHFHPHNHCPHYSHLQLMSWHRFSLSSRLQPFKPVMVWQVRRDLKKGLWIVGECWVRCVFWEREEWIRRPLTPYTLTGTGQDCIRCNITHTKHIHWEPFLHFLASSHAWLDDVCSGRQSLDSFQIRN